MCPNKVKYLLVVEFPKAGGGEGGGGGLLSEDSER